MKPTETQKDFCRNLIDAISNIHYVVKKLK